MRTDTRTRSAAAARDAGYAMPAEWAPHARTWMSWPGETYWPGPQLDRTRRAYAAVARAVRRFEPVTVIADPADAASVPAYCGAGIEVVALPIDDSWIRDNGPSFVVGRGGALAGVAWRFNAWGAKVPHYAKDAALAERLLGHLGLPCLAADITLEGGAIHVDGEGTVLTTESVVLNDNRNPGLTRREAEREIRRALGAEKVIWLPGRTDTFTDGHVDGVACFVRPGVVCAVSADDPEHPQHEVYRENQRAIELATDAKGRGLEIVTIEDAWEAEARGELFIRSYVNFYVANGGVVMPAYGVPGDARARAVVARLFPDREVVSVDVNDIAINGGAVHCITQQQPAV